MAHMIDMTNGRANIAFMGSRNDVWHRLGQEMLPGMTIEQWAAAAGLGWTANMVPAFAQLPNGEMRAVDGQRFLTRSDNGYPLGYVSDGYKPVQPAEVLAWFNDYITVDDRFHLDVAGSLKNGEIIWATATFNGDMTVAGDAHRARVLMTTSFDGSQATINQATMTRTVCNNTLKVATADKRAVVRTRHSGRFNPARVASELATLAQSFDAYRAMGDAMATITMSDADISAFFKATLDIPHDAQRKDISTRKFNQFGDVMRSYNATVREGTPKGTAWAALNAVTRYADHDRSVRSSSVPGSDEIAARFLSANFGTGDQLKAKAVDLLAGQYSDSGEWHVRRTMPESVPVPASMLAAAGIV